MDAVKQWIICIIFCSVIAAVVNILTPDKSVQKAMKTVVASFLICSFLYPVISGEKIDITSDLPDFSYFQSSLSENVSDTMLRETEKLIHIRTEELLKELGVKYYEIKVDAGINHENSIFLEKIAITLSAEYMHREKQITSNLKTMFSVEAEYVWVEK